MKSFNAFIKDQAIDQYLSESSLYDVESIFKDIRLDMIEDIKASDEKPESEAGQRFRLTATTRKGSYIQQEIGLSELLSISFIKTLTDLSYS